MKIEEKDSPSKNDQIEAYLSAQYKFRYNTVMHRAEYRLRGKGDYTSVDRYRINTLKRALDKEPTYRPQQIICTALLRAISPLVSIPCKTIPDSYQAPL